MKVLIVDPPSGWKYGFPKPVPSNKATTEWFLDNGYPQFEIDRGMLEHVRFWYEEEEEEDTDES